MRTPTQTLTLICCSGLCLFLAACQATGDHVQDAARIEAEAVLREFDANGDGRIVRDELPPEERDAFDDVDSNGDGFVTVDEILEEFAEEFEEATFDVVGDRAFMTGVIGPTTPALVRALFAEHPGVRCIELEDVPGSMDDEANLEAARLVRARGVATHVSSDGEIASGGVDFFLAGASRTIEVGARLGVHSWGFENFQGADLARDRTEHRPYLDFYEEMGIPTDFYWYTLQSASAENIHWMTTDEIARYRVVTSPIITPATPRDDSYGLDALRPEKGERGIVELPDTVHPAIRRLFNRYTRVVAPNGRPLHILAQAAWTTDQIVRARKVLEHMLAPAANTEYGADKTAVANAMAERRATLALFDDHEAMERGFRSRFGRLRLGVQDLRANECPVEGSPDYMRHETRDAAFEEILHLVHDYGIRPALPDYDQKLQAANDAAADRGIWDPWPRDEPDSHRNEYIAAAYDNYLDLWTVPPTRYEGELIPASEIPPGTSHFGTYKGGSRTRLRDLDPTGFALVEAFFPPHLTYTPELPADFDGVFSIVHDSTFRYTTTSQHLRSVQLTGSRDAGLVGNNEDNELAGNTGNNTLEGRGGDDTLSGSAGEDTAVFLGPRSDYTVEVRGDHIVVIDSKASRDGTDTLTGIEQLQFSDRVEPAPKRR